MGSITKLAAHSSLPIEMPAYGWGSTKVTLS